MRASRSSSCTALRACLRAAVGRRHPHVRRYKTERKYYAVNMTQFNSLLLDLHVPDQVRRLGPTIFTRARAHKCIRSEPPRGTGPQLGAPTCAPELGPPLPHLHRDWAVLCAHAIEGYIRDAVGLARHEGTYYQYSTGYAVSCCDRSRMLPLPVLSDTRVRVCSAVCAEYSHAWTRQHAGRSSGEPGPRDVAHGVGRGANPPVSTREYPVVPCRYACTHRATECR